MLDPIIHNILHHKIVQDQNERYNATCIHYLVFVLYPFHIHIFTLNHNPVWWNMAINEEQSKNWLIHPQQPLIKERMCSSGQAACESLLWQNCVCMNPLLEPLLGKERINEMFIQLVWSVMPLNLKSATRLHSYGLSLEKVQPSLIP